MRKFEVVKAYENTQPLIPKRQTKDSAGYDFAAIEETTIQPGEIVLVKTGIKAMIPHDEVLLVYARSSLAIKKGLMMSNGVGVVDADYYNNLNNEGHIMVPLYNYSNHPVTILKNERIAQGIFQKYFKTIDDNPIEVVRKGGFGSSTKES